MEADRLSHALDMVDLFLDEEKLPVSPDHPCPYLPGMTTRVEGFFVDRMDPEIHDALMDRGFRRAGKLIYRPVCPDCRACRELRVPVARFRPSRSQHRVWRRNADLRVTVKPPHLTERRWRLYRDYLDFQHDQTMSRDRQDMAQFLYESPVDTIEFCYYLGRQLVGVSVADRSRCTLNSVYMYFDPQHHRRSLGTYSALWEIDYCRRAGMAYYYLGFCVAGCRKMAYKSRFEPCQMLDATHTWVTWNPQEQP